MSDALTLAASSLVEPFEGFVPHPYQDSTGVWTIGIGSTRDAAGKPVTASTPDVTMAQALALGERDLKSALAAITNDVTVPLTTNETAALADFIYNLGAGNFAASTLLQKLNAGDYNGAAEQFERWDHARGQVLLGLLRRRLAEANLFVKA